ncbi:MAG: DUF11 domain-containing protein [Saprospiraceae bacterium]|nr:DUF11 domain-containing protein [Saprospiraceae bacterium]
MVTNTGNQTLTNVSATDILPDGSTGTLSGPVESLSNNGEINVGETWTYTINYTVTQSDIDAGANLVNNVSVITDEVPGPTTDTETTPVDQNPSLTVSKTQTSGPNPVTAAGQVIGYTIVVTNTGNQTLTNVSATDILPDGSTGTLSGPVESLSNNGEINVGETWTYTINYTVTQSDIDAGANLVNNVSVITDEVPGPTTDTETTPIDQNPSLTVSKTQTSGPNPVTAAGQVIGYTIVVTNTGNQTLTNAGITDILPDGSTGTLSGPVESLSSNGEINVGETWTYTINYTVTQSDIDAGANLVNNVSVITDEVPGPTTDNETTLVDQNPSLTVSKTQTSGPNPVSGAGQVIGYTIVVTNTGNQTLTNAGITDILPDGSTGTMSGPVESLSSNGEINVGETWTYTINYTVTQSDIDAGANLVNNVSVITDEVPGPTTDNETTLVDQNPSLTVSKTQTSGPNPVTAAGQVIGYTIVVTNTGNQTLTNAGITDILPDGSTGTMSGPVESLSSNGEINVGETWTYTINYTVTQSDIDAGFNLVNNVSVITDEVPGPTSANATTPIDQNPSLMVVKSQTSGPNPVTAAGQVIGYTIVVTNTGNQTLTNVSATDILPDGSTGTMSGPVESLSSNGEINVGETWTYTINYTVTQSDIDAGANLVNNVSVTTDEVPGPTTDNETTLVDQNPSLMVVKSQTSGPSPVTAAGQVIGYTIVVTNTGNQTLTNAGITDILPDGSTGTMSGPVESLSSNGEINVGETWTYTINYTVTQSDIDAGANLVNNVSVITDEVPGPTTDNETTLVDQNPSLTVSKTQTSGPNPVTAAGQVIGYTIVVTNTGNQTLTNVSATDILPDGSTGTLSGPVESLSNNGEINVGETWTYTINYTVTQSDIDAGANLVNNVSVTTDEVPGPTTDNETTPLDQNPSLTVIKTQTSGPNPVTGAGQVIGYTIVVTNTGNQTLTNVSTTDILPNGANGTLSGPVESLSSNGEINVGETWTYTISYMVTQSNIDAGFNLVNNVSVVTTEVPGPTSANATTPIDQNPSLMVVKSQTSGPNPVTAAGQVLGYTIVVTNTGNQTLTNASITDILPDGSTGTLSGPVESLSSNGEINVGETWTYIINYVVTQSDIDAGTNLVNNVTVVTTEVPGPTTDDATTPVDQNPSFTILKTQTGGPAIVSNAGDIIDYTIILTNTGNQTLTNVSITDTMPDGTIDALITGGVINAGEMWVYNTSYTVTQADIDSGLDLINIVVAMTNEVPGALKDTENTPVDQNPSLTVSKTQTSGPSPVTAAGQVLGYTIVVTNTGNQTLTNVSATDILPDGSTGTMSGPIESLSSNGEINVGETWTYTINYTVTQADIDAGAYLVNTVSIVTDEVPGPTTDDATTSVGQAPAMVVEKTQTGGPNPVTSASQVIDYTIIITNIGNATLTNINTSDLMPDGTIGSLTGPIESGAMDGEISVGESWTYIISYTVTQSDIDAGISLVNTISANSSETPLPVSDFVSTPIDQNPSLTVSKTQTSGPSPVTAAGQVIGYTIVVTNTGNQTLTNAGITDILPDGSTGTMSGPVESLSSNGEINVGETWTYTINYTVTQSDIDAGANLVNNVSVITDEVPGPTTDNETTLVDQNPSLTVIKTQTSGPNPVTGAGQVIGYTIVVTNTGNQTLTNVSTTDILPNGANGTLSGPVESLSSNGEINVGETWTYTINYTVTQSDIDAGFNLVNNVSVMTDEVPGPTSANATTPIDQNPSLMVVKSQTSGPNPVTGAGQVIGYTIVVTNTGNQTLTNVSATDILPDGSTGTMSGPVESLSSNGEINVGETWTYTINYTVTQSDIDAGFNLVNNVSVTTDEVPGPTTDNETTLVDQNPSLMVVKSQTSGPNPVTAAGQVIGYTIVVTNTGNQTLTNVSATDILPDGSTGTMSGPVESLSSNGEINVGETWTHTINYTVTQSDIDAGANLVNNVSVTTDEVPGPTTDNETTLVDQNPSLTVSKIQTSGPNPVTAAGQVIGYTIVVTNTGNQTLTNAGITDILPDGSTGTLSGPVESLSSNGEINVGETWTYTINYTVTQSDIDAGANLVNNVSVMTTEVPGPTTDSAATPINQSPSLVVDKSQSGGPNPVVNAGETIDYTIIVTNSGNQTLTNLIASDLMPDGSIGILNGPFESLSINGELNVGEVWTYSISYTVSQSDIDDGTPLVNLVSVVTNEVPGPIMDDATTFVGQNASLSVLKTQIAGPNPVIASGQQIDYLIQVTNTGNVSLNNAMISDVLPDGSVGALLGPIESSSTNGVIDIGETWTYTISYMVSQSDIDFGTDLVNTVSVTTNEVPGPTSDDAITPILQNPSIIILKTGAIVDNIPIGHSAGDEITYQFSVTNTGNVTLTNVIVNDLLVSVTGSPIDTLLPGETNNTTFTASYLITQTDIDNGSFINQAFVTGTPPIGPDVTDDDTDDQNFIQSPSIELVKTGVFSDLPPTGYNPGDQINYTFWISNTGNVSLSNINLIDLSVTILGGPLGGLIPGEVDSTTFSAVYTITQQDIDNGSFTNTAQVSGTAPDNTVVVDEDDDVQPMIQMPSLTVMKNQTGGPSPVTAAGDLIMYEIEITNTGNVTINNVAAEDQLPDGTTFFLSMPTESLVNDGNLNVGETWTYSTSYIATQNDIDIGNVLINVVSVSSTEVPGPTVDDAHTSVSQNPSFTVVKSQVGGPNPVSNAGEIIDYQINIINTGNSTLTNVLVSDILPDLSAGTLSGPFESVSANAELNVGETWTYTISYAVVQADIDAGNDLVNTVYVSTQEVPGPISDDAVTSVSQNPSLVVLKDQTGGPAIITTAGQLIDYTIQIINTGNQTLTSVNVSDILPSGLLGILSGPFENVLSDGKINIGETWTYLLTYEVLQSDIDSGNNVVNTVYVTTQEIPGPISDDAATAVQQTSAIDLQKTGVYVDLPPMGYNAGDEINYEFVVTNTGNVTLINVYILDFLVTVIGGPLDSLLPGQSNIATFTATYKVTQNDIDNGNFSNQAFVFGTPPQGPEISDDDVDDQSFTQNPSIALLKTGSYMDLPPLGSSAGDVINYQFKVTNTGNVTLSDISLIDPLVIVTGGPLSSLAPGETDSTTFIAGYIVTQNDIDSGYFTNTAYAEGTAPDNSIVIDDDGDTQNFIKIPAITVSKSQTGGANPVTTAGDEIEYTIEVINTGNITIHNVVAVDIQPDGSFGALNGPFESLTSNGVLNVGETWIYTIIYPVTQNDIDLEADLVNTVSVYSLEVPGPTTDDATTPLATSPAVTVTKIQTGGPSPVTASGQVIEYTIVVSNTGNQSLTNVLVSDLMPDGSNGMLNGPVESISSNDSLNVGETWTHTISYVVTQSDIDAGLALVNRAVVTTDETPDPTPDEETTPVDQNPSLTIVKTQTGGPSPVTASGQMIEYTIVVSNTGNQSLTNVLVSDLMPDGSNGMLNGPVESISSNDSLNVGETWTYTISYVVTQSDIDAGLALVNRAVVTTDETPDPTPDEETTPVDQNPSLTIVKTQTGGPSPVTAAGQVIEYTIVVSNTGNQSLTNVLVSDLMPDGSNGMLNGPVESISSNDSLNVGETWTYTISYVVTQSDIDAGLALVNRAVVTTDETPDPTPDEETTPVDQNPSLTIVKTQTGGPSPVTASGQVLEYTIVVSNTGNQSLTNVLVSDLMPDGSNGMLNGPVESISSNDSLNVGETWTYTISYEVTQDDIDVGLPLVNNVSVTTTETPDPTPDDETTPVDQNPSMTVAKTQTGGPSPVTAAGQVIEYSIQILNTGNQTLTNIVIDDIMPDGSIGLLSGPFESNLADGVININEFWTYTTSYTITQSDIDAGLPLVNNVIVTTAETPDPTPDDETTPVEQNPSLTVVKTQIGGPSPVTAAGQVLEYAIVVSNTGNQSLTNVLVSDLMPDGSNGMLNGPVESISSNDSLNVGETWTYTISYVVTQSDIDAGLALVNRAVVTTDETPDPTTDDATTPLATSPAVTVTKIQTGGPSPVTAAGQVIEYTIVVSNTGNQSLTNVLVSDLMPDGSNGMLNGPVESISSNDSLNVGETWTYTISYVVTQSDIDAGLALVNRAVVTTDETPDPTPDEETTPVDQNPSLTIVKTQTGGPSPVTASGQMIEYTIVVSNTGNQSLTNVLVSDLMPDGSNGMLNGPVESISSNDSLNVGETWTYTISYVVTQSDIDAGLALVNRAVVTTDETPDPTPDEETTPVDQNPSLTIVKTQTGGPSPVTASGQVIEYTIVVSNTGNQSLTNVLVSDLMPDGSNGMLNGPVESISSNDSLNVGETWTYTISYVVTQSDIDAGLALVNRAVVTTDETPDPTPDEETTPVDQNPSLTIVKTQTGGPSPVTASGQVLEYTIVVSNTGNQSLTNVLVSDLMPDGSNGMLNGPVESISSNDSLNVGETWTYTISYVVTQSDIDAGLALVNRAVVTTDETPDPTPDEETTPVDQNPSMTVAKTQIGGPSPVTAAGQVIDYTIVLTNTGNQTLTNVNTVDLMPDGSAGMLGLPIESLSANDSLNVGEIWTYTISYVVTQEDIDSGADLVNNAVVTTTETPDPTPDDETTPVDQQPSMTVVKTQTSGPSPVTAAGQVIGYTIVLTNTGNQTLTNVNTMDEMPDGSVGVLGLPIESLSSNDSLNVGETWTYTISYVVTQGDIDAGLPMVNNVVVTTTETPDPTPDDETTPVDQQPSMTVVKTQTSGPSPVTAAGQVIGYTIVLTNTGNQTLTNVNTVDEMPDGSEGMLGLPIESLSANDSLNVGETWTYTISYVVTQDDTDSGGDLVNKVSVTTTETPNPTMDDETTWVNSFAAISIVKGSSLDLGPDGQSSPGDLITFTYQVTNLGNQSLTNVVVDENSSHFTGTGILPFPAFISASMGSAEGSLKPGETATYSALYAITQLDINSGEVVNQATTECYTPNGGTLTDYSDSSNPMDPNETGTPSDPGGNDPTTTIIPPSPPIANDDQDLDNVPGSDVTIYILGNDFSFTTAPATFSNSSVVLIDPATGMPTLTPNVVTIAGQGVYTYDPLTGNLTFNPNPGFTTDPTPIDYVLTEIATGLSDDAEVTITYQEKPPIANDDQDLDNVPGTDVTINILANDFISDGNPATVANTSVVLIDPATGMPTLIPNMVTIPNQGVYSYDPLTGDLTFNPNPGFTTDPTPIDYVLTESLTGLSDDATVTITYLEIPPVANDDQDQDNVPGTDVTINILANDFISDGNPVTVVNTSVVLIDPATGMPTLTPNMVTIPGQGVYTYDPLTGNLTFNPNTGFTTDPTPVNYILTETLTGLTDPATVTITYLETPPVANNDQDLDNVPGTDVTLNILLNDQISDGSPATVSNTSVLLIDPSTGMPTLTPNVVTIPGQGVYTYDPMTGNLTFNPNTGFTTDPTPINYVLTETLTGLNDAATITITYLEIPPVANNDEDLDNYPGNNVTISILSNDQISDGSAVTIGNTTVVLINPATGMPTATPNMVAIPGQGVYTYTPATGSLTFAPNVGFVEDPTPINYILTETATGLSDPATVTITYLDIVHSIGSYVWEDLNGDGIYQANEPGIPDVQVELYDPMGNLIATTYTDPTGHFIFRDIPAGDYYFRFLPSPEYLFTFPDLGNNNNIDSDVTGAFGFGTTPVSTFNTGEIDLTWFAGLYKCIMIGHKVFYDVDKDDILDAIENGINGLKVNIWRVNGNMKSIWESTYTGHQPGTGSTDGYFKFCVPPGNYYIEVIMPPIGLVQARANIGTNENVDSDLTNANGQATTATFTVLSGQMKTDIGAGFYPMATAGNLVWIDENNDGLQQSSEPRVANILVEAFDSLNQKVGEDLTDTNGEYLIDYLGKSSYYLKFSPPSGYGYTVVNYQEDAANSDVDHTNGLNTTRVFEMWPGSNYINIDAGLAFGALPVRWLDVSAVNKGYVNQIDWSTSSELNSEKFIVERRFEDETEFIPVAEVKAAGQSSEVRTYQAFDEEIQRSGVYYYRIMELDLDGSKSYSKVVAVNVTREENMVSLYPNPAKDFSTLSVELKGRDDASVEIYSVDGHHIRSAVLKADGRNGVSQKYKIQGLPPGVYMIHIVQNEFKDVKKLILSE